MVSYDSYRVKESTL